MKNNLKIILLTCCIFLRINAKAQSCTDVEEWLRKRHTIPNMTYGHPYTTFDRHNGQSLMENIINIRAIISKKNEKDNVYQAYQAIYENAKKAMPSDNGMSNEGVSELALWAKDNAFVFLVGMNPNGELLDLNDPSGAQRDAFRHNAINLAFHNLSGEIDHDNAGWGWVYAASSVIAGYTSPLTAKALIAYNLNNEQEFIKKLQFHSRSLILWLQTYDLLKAAYELRTELDSIAPHRYPWGFGDADRNKHGSCAPRRKLRKLTRDLYYYSEGKDGVVEHAYGWKRNHGIAAACAILMAAQVLNDAGVETSYTKLVASAIFPIYGLLNGYWQPIPHPTYSPINTII